MTFYEIVKEYVKYNRMDINNQTVFSVEDIKNKIEYFRNKIKEQISNVEDSNELKRIINDFKFILTPKEEFMIYNQLFHLIKGDKAVVESFIDILYFWGPDYDEDIEIIVKLLEKSEIEKASELCMNIKY